MLQGNNFRCLIELMLVAPVFLSDGEIETLTGYSKDEYVALAEFLRDDIDIETLSRDHLIMINQATNTMGSLPIGGEDLYIKYLGKGYKSVFQEIFAETSSRIPSYKY